MVLPCIESGLLLHRTYQALHTLHSPYLGKHLFYKTALDVRRSIIFLGLLNFSSNKGHSYYNPYPIHKEALELCAAALLAQ